jgi:hypothetical protein
MIPNTTHTPRAFVDTEACLVCYLVLVAGLQLTFDTARLPDANELLRPCTPLQVYMNTEVCVFCYALLLPSLQMTH